MFMHVYLECSVDVEGHTEDGDQDDEDVEDVPHGLEVRALVLLDLITQTHQHIIT